MRKISNRKNWYGEIPNDWKVDRIGSVFKLRNTKVSDYDYRPLSVTMNGIVPQLESAAKTNAHDDRKLVKAGDFAINSRSDRRGACGISNYDGSVSLINTVVTPMENINSKYYDYLFHSASFADEFYKWGHGIVDDLWTTGWGEMKNIRIPIPPIKIQEKIAKFLSLKCGVIDEIVEKINIEIEELKKYKKSLITKSVIKGLNQNIPMRDSGIEWIGKIPETWNIKKLKYITKLSFKGNGITKEEVFEDGDTFCVRYGEIYTKYNNFFSECLSKTKKDIVENKQYFLNGDILFACTGELIEEIGKSVVYVGDEECLAGGDIFIVRTNENVKFINYASNSYVQKQKSIGKAKLKVVHISMFDILNLLIVVPSKKEQQQIVNYLDDKCAKVDDIINNKIKQIETMRKYKKSLIYEYVTGKKSV